MKLPLFGIGMQGKTPVVTAKLLQELYIDFRPQGEKTQVVAHGFAGLDLFVDFGDTSVRGNLSIEQNDLHYAVHRGTLWELNNAGVKVSRGTLNTVTGAVGMAHNGTQLMIVDGTYGYIYDSAVAAQAISSITRVGTTATLTTSADHGLATGMQVTVSGATPSQYNGTYTITVTGATTFTYTMASDPGGSASPVGSYVIALAFAQIASGFPANPTSVTFQDGRFIVSTDFENLGRFYISAAYDGFTWDALDFANAESDPDRLIRVFADHGELILFGDISTEFWSNIGTLFPYARTQGANAEWGLAARHSVAKFDDSVAFLCKNRMGEVIVGKLVGHAVQKLSTPDLDTIINGYSVTSDATAHSYMLGGHPMYQINFPAAGESWSFDGLSSIWTKRKSYGMTRHRCEFGAQFLSETIVTDAENGRLYRLNSVTLTENGDPMEAEIIGEHWDAELDRITIDKLRVDIEVGVGNSGQGENPQAMLSVSKDGGKTFGLERWKPIGKTGDYKRRVEWHRLGQSRRWTVKLRITDPVRKTILGAYVNPVN